MSKDQTEKMDGSAKTETAPIRVALFSGNFNYLVDGAAKALNQLAAHLGTRNIDVLVFSPTVETPAFPEVARVVSVPSLPLPGRGEYLLGLGLTPKVKAELDAFKPTLIHISAPDLLCWRAMRYAQKNDLPCVVSFHTRYDSYMGYYGAAWLEALVMKWLRYIHKSCDRVLAPTDETEAWLRDNDMAQSFGRWARGVDPAQFNPAFRNMDWRRSHGIADDEQVVLFCARLVAEKNLKQFARVIDKVRAAGHAPRVMIVGDGPERKSFEADLPDNSVFTGFLAGDDLATAYASADTLFYPSITEAFPNVVLEAMASGLAVVCANTIGANTVVTPNETGFLVDIDADDDYAEKVITLLTEDMLRQRFGAASLKASKRFDWVSVLDEVVDNYRDVIAHHDMAG